MDKDKKVKKWTKEELDKHIQINCKESAGSYSMVVVLAALYMKIYGQTLPDIGLSGFQGETAERLSKVFPDTEKYILSSIKTIEHALRDKILYIGEEIPESLMKDNRPKFIILGTPQELIDEVSPQEIKK